MLSVTAPRFLSKGTKLAFTCSLNIPKRFFSSTLSGNDEGTLKILTTSKVTGQIKESKGEFISTGCPEITPDPVVMANVSAQLKREHGYVFRTNKVSVLEHSYISAQNVTSDGLQLGIDFLGLSKFLRVIASPKFHLLQWLFSFPFGTQVELLDVNDGVARLMDSDPVKLSQVTAKQVDTEGGSEARVTTFVDRETLFQVLCRKPESPLRGMAVMHFLAQTLVDLGGKSHMLPGSVCHSRVVGYNEGKVSVWEYRLGMGGGSPNGGALNNVVGYLTWKAQFNAIEEMFAHKEFWEFADKLCDCTSPDELVFLINTYQQKWSAKPKLIWVLNQLANPIRYALTGYAHTKGVSSEDAIGGRYAIKQVRL